jgi:hypothetical protein
VLGTYVNEYFDKEMTHIRQQYIALLRRSIDDPSLVSSGTVLHLPHVKAERFKSIGQITKCITRNLIKSLFAVTTDTVCRMESIGRDDKKKLPIYIKEICLFQLSVIHDGMYIPILKQLTNLLLKNASAIYKQPANMVMSSGAGGGVGGGTGGGGSGGGAGGGNSGSGGGSGNLISYDILDFLVIICTYREEYGTIFQSIFQRPLLDYPNLLVICKDMKKQAFQAMIQHCKETLYAWEVGIVLYLEKTLMAIQSKFDFAPKFDPLVAGLNHLGQNMNQAVNQLGQLVDGQPQQLQQQSHPVSHRQSTVGGGGSRQSQVSMAGIGTTAMGPQQGNTSLSPTAACDAVCKVIIRVTQSVRAKDTDLEPLDIDHIYWKPFGQQFIAVLIAHIRKFKISQMGARQLLRDLEEYRNVSKPNIEILAFFRFHIFFVSIGCSINEFSRDVGYDDLS